MKKHFWSTAGAALLCASMLAGCSNTSSSTTSGAASTGDSTAASAAPAGDTVKIGLNFELTGNVADYGTKELNGAKIAVDMFNAREDKPFTVETVEFDDKGEPAESVAGITKLIEQDKVVGVVGPATSASSIATYDFASSKQVPVISPSATQVDAMMNNGTPYEYAWRVCFEDSYQGKAMADYAVNELGAKKAVILNEVSDYGIGLADAFAEELDKLGGEVLDRSEYQSGDKDFASFITKIKDLDFDVIYIAGYYNEAAQIIKTAQADGIDKPIIGADGLDSADLISQIGATNANNIYYTTAYSAIDASDDLKAFIEAYKAEYGEDPSMFAALSYDATNMLLSALESSGKTGAELNEAIKNVDFSGVTGSFSFDEATHTPKKSVLVVELVDGVQSNVKEVEAE
ncbi:ABC transporter substrate-binding protein [Allobaculum mucilyticum]|uniref:ABC transporter substrate-binding protein n=1 Tax=Allobaculum mucilyticum TaxID=2834459 RepID=UPI001E439068|nr:ABC transporter substrate-binding protein [Allobaculum mucilyticum]UNT95392.1 ABC transporter substrate-binding protein [Allobaculum mucilyticum]